MVRVLTYLQWKLKLEQIPLPQIPLYCFESLGLKNRTINATTSKCSMECSFCIWMARNNKALSFKEINVSLRAPEDPFVHQKSPCHRLQNKFLENQFTSSGWFYR